MPPFLKALAFIGMLAMLWVGGGILVHGLAEYGIKGPEHVVHDVSHMFANVPAVGPILTWLAGAAMSAVVGLVAGGLVALLMKPFMSSGAAH
jgi:predicted DNA repair protein MutK